MEELRNGKDGRTVFELEDYVQLDRHARKKFRCLRCGRCCSSLIIGPISSKDMARIVRHDERSLKYFKNYIRYGEKSGMLMAFKIITNKKGNAGGCAFYDPKRRRCTIYHSRPSICRAFPFRTDTLAWKHCEWVKRYLKAREQGGREGTRIVRRREKHDRGYRWNAWKR